VSIDDDVQEVPTKDYMREIKGREVAEAGMATLLIAKSDKTLAPAGIRTRDTPYEFFFPG
jgi:hypothetical protein